MFDGRDLGGGRDLHSLLNRWRHEARGVPLGFRTRQHMALLVRRFGVLRKMIVNGLSANDPHAMVLEVEVHDINVVSPSIRWSEVIGAPVIQLLVVPPPPPLLPPTPSPTPPSSLPPPPLLDPPSSLPSLPPSSSPPPPTSTLPLPPVSPLSPSASTGKTSLRSPVTNRVLSSATASRGSRRRWIRTQWKHHNRV